MFPAMLRVKLMNTTFDYVGMQATLPLLDDHLIQILLTHSSHFQSPIIRKRLHRKFIAFGMRSSATELLFAMLDKTDSVPWAPWSRILSGGIRTYSRLRNASFSPRLWASRRSCQRLTV